MLFSQTAYTWVAFKSLFKSAIERFSVLWLTYLQYY